VSHGEQYPASVTPFCYGSPTDVFAASYIYIHYALMNTKMAVVANAIVHKQGSLQWFKFMKRLEFSAGQWPV
jgi:hypothetical protein